MENYESNLLSQPQRPSLQIWAKTLYGCVSVQRSKIVVFLFSTKVRGNKQTKGFPIYIEKT